MAMCKRLKEYFDWKVNLSFTKTYTETSRTTNVTVIPSLLLFMPSLLYSVSVRYKKFFANMGITTSSNKMWVAIHIGHWSWRNCHALILTWNVSVCLAWNWHPSTATFPTKCILQAGAPSFTGSRRKFAQRDSNY